MMRKTTPFPARLPRLRASVLAVLAAASTLAAGASTAGDAAAPQDLTTLPFEQLLSMEVYSASKFKQSARRAPSSVTVITADDIRHHGWRTLADVARTVRSVYVSNDRNYSYVGERGFMRPGDYNTRFLLQVDGNRINDAVYDQAPMGGEFPLDLELIERIEFVPGPGSSIYGSSAFFGVINVITKKGGALAGVRTALEVGQAGERRAFASAAWRTEHGTDIALAASRHRSDGKDLYYPEFDTPEQNHGVAAGLDDERGSRLFARAGRGPLSVTLMHAERIKGVPTASFFQPFNDPRSETTDRQSYLNAAWRSVTGAGDELKARLFWGRYDSYGNYILDDAARTLSHDGSGARWWGAELSLLSTRVEGHTLLAGADLQRDYRLHQYNYDVAPFHSYLEERRRAYRAGVYLQDEVALGDQALLNLGLRYDRSSGATGVLSPRGALIYTLNQDTTVKAIYGSAFRAANNYEKYYAYPGEDGQTANPALRRETIRSAELAVVHQLTGRARLSASVFRNHLGNLITLVPHPDLATLRFENSEQVRVRGIELEYERNWGSGATLRTSYSWVRIGAEDQGRQVNAPARLAKLNLAAPLGLPGLKAAIDSQYISARRGINGTVPAYWVVNANLIAARLRPGLEASLGVSNLFDRRYADPGAAEHLQTAIAQDGRRLRARLSYAF